MTHKKLEHIIDIQRANVLPKTPTDNDLLNYANLVLNEKANEAMEVTIRLVDSEEIASLNKEFRKKDKPTNVLSFPSEIPDFVEISPKLLGDVIICPDVLIKEAKEQHKTYDNHFAHITIHGILHLLGFDHIKPEDAVIMEAIEIELLQTLGINNPYEEITNG